MMTRRTFSFGLRNRISRAFRGEAKSRGESHVHSSTTSRIASWKSKSGAVKKSTAIDAISIASTSGDKSSPPPTLSLPPIDTRLFSDDEVQTETLAGLILGKATLTAGNHKKQDDLKQLVIHKRRDTCETISSKSSDRTISASSVSTSASASSSISSWSSSTVKSVRHADQGVFFKSRSREDLKFTTYRQRRRTAITSLSLITDSPATNNIARYAEVEPHTLNDELASQASESWILEAEAMEFVDPELAIAKAVLTVIGQDMLDAAAEQAAHQDVLDELADRDEKMPYIDPFPLLRRIVDDVASEAQTDAIVSSLENLPVTEPIRFGMASVRATKHGETKPKLSGMSFIRKHEVMDFIQPPKNLVSASLNISERHSSDIDDQSRILLPNHAKPNPSMTREPTPTKDSLKTKNPMVLTSLLSDLLTFIHDPDDDITTDKEILSQTPAIDILTATDLLEYINGPEEIYASKKARLERGKFAISRAATDDLLDHINRYDARDFVNIKFDKAYLDAHK
jgi:hypothetical protein